jgi:hypothetical protein
MDFKVFKNEVAAQFERMQKHDMFRVDILNEKDESIIKDKLWETYLSSFPPGTNLKYKERTEFDCQCCRQFIRAVGSVVAIINGKKVTVWDVVSGGFLPVAERLAALVHSAKITDVFLHTEHTAGTEKSLQQTPDGIITWEHFFVKIPAANYVAGVELGTKLGLARSTRDVFHRALRELTPDAVTTVLDLINQGSLYRGEEHKFAVESFRKYLEEFRDLNSPEEQELYSWSKVKNAVGSVTGIRNTSIGTLLVDLSDGKELEHAVASFEAKVAPINYKRPTALVTKAMIEKAQKAIVDLGLSTALERRYATIQDITINNILFADRDAKKSMMGDVFDTLKEASAENPKNFDKVEEIGIEAFIKNVLPNAESIELMLENRHSSNLVSLIAPTDPTAAEMFKWPNRFSWSYTGELADSIKERVKVAGGNVAGDLRCSLSWFNLDDLDLHMYEPGGYEIYFANARRLSPNRGVLDVDMNAGVGRTRTAVENISYQDRGSMKEGIYKLFVHNFAQRETIDVGFEVEVEFDGAIHSMHYGKALKDRSQVAVMDLHYSKRSGFKIVNSLPSSQASRILWGVPTQAFRKVSVMMMSPNFWDDKTVGNKHYFFMLDGCLNDGKARGFFNEFFKEELTPHRKVLEMVGSKMRTDESDRQLSGLGFSSTQRNSVLCRVKGSFNRVVKITF